MAPEFSSDAARKPAKWWWVLVILALVAVAGLSMVLEISAQLDLSILFVFALLAMSMGFLWGYAGILSFGQTVFFGLGGYSYAIIAMNIGVTGPAFLAALVVPVLFAAVLGYFMIYGRISEIYLSVITLVVTLIFEKSVRSTSGPEYVIGKVRLNGQNGIPGVLPLELPFVDVPLSIEGVFVLSGVLLILAYTGLRMVLTTRFGRILVGIRENERRMELLGYDTRRYKLLAFMLAGGIAALSGAMYAVWGNFVAPEMFNLNQASQVVIWVIVGGRSTLIGPVIGTGLVQYLTAWLGTAGVGQVTVILGIVLIAFVLAFPRGIVPTLGDFLSRIFTRKGDAK